MSFLAEQSHRRFNPLTGDWVLVSPHRSQRPWLGQVEAVPTPAPAAYDPACYLCPGNERAGGRRNPDYTSTFVFDNDFAALIPSAGGSLDRDGLLVAEAEPGLCRVICFSPDHSLTLSGMSTGAVASVVDVWAAETESLERQGYGAVQIFENRGEMMGASNPHPHCQVWATTTVPNEIRREDDRQRAWLDTRGAPLLADYLGVERDAAERIVCANAFWTAIVPFWAIWPFETLLVPTRDAGTLAELTQPERLALAEVLRDLTARYDRLFNASFPYTMGFHQRPAAGLSGRHFTLHAHFYPPLLRSATVRKFMVGYEMLASPQRDITPESAAARLRALG